MNHASNQMKSTKENKLGKSKSPLNVKETRILSGKERERKREGGKGRKSVEDIGVIETAKQCLNQIKLNHNWISKTSQSFTQILYNQRKRENGSERDQRVVPAKQTTGSRFRLTEPPETPSSPTRL